jgi:hypothetical protein
VVVKHVFGSTYKWAQSLREQREAFISAFAFYVSFCLGSWTRNKVMAVQGIVTANAKIKGNTGETDS